jgi:flavin-dependent dehydrogenase
LEETHAVNPLMKDGNVSGVLLKGPNETVTPIRADITIDATGRTRAVARRIERQTDHAPAGRPRFVAFKAHLEGTRGAPGHCEIYSYRGGYGGLNSVEGGVSNFCFIASAGDVRKCGNDADRVIEDIVTTNRRAAYTLAEARNASPWLAVSIDAFGKHKLVPAGGLLAIGDAASFIDPFTGSGMLMALESGELAAAAVTQGSKHVNSNGKAHNATFDLIAELYRRSYREKFTRRLRMCSLLRRTAFIPRLADTAIFILGHSAFARRHVTHATRPIQRTS